MTFQNKLAKAANERLAIWAQAEAMGLPAFMTPLWKAKHGKQK